MFAASGLVENDYAVYAVRSDDPDPIVDSHHTVVRVVGPASGNTRREQSIYAGPALTYARVQAYEAGDALLVSDESKDAPCRYSTPLQVRPQAGLRVGERFSSSAVASCAFGAYEVPPYPVKIEGEVLGSGRVTTPAGSFDAIQYMTQRTGQLNFVNGYNQVETWTESTRTTCWAERQTAMSLQCEAVTEARSTYPDASVVRRYTTRLDLDAYSVKQLGAPVLGVRAYAGIWRFDLDSSAPFATACSLGIAVAVDGKVWSNSCDVRLNGTWRSGVTEGAVDRDGNYRAEFVANDNRGDPLRVQYQGKLASLYEGGGTATDGPRSHAWTLRRGAAGRDSRISPLGSP